LYIKCKDKLIKIFNTSEKTSFWIKTKLTSKLKILQNYKKILMISIYFYVYKKKTKEKFLKLLIRQHQCTIHIIKN
jgi:hypothetical protein